MDTTPHQEDTVTDTDRQHRIDGIRQLADWLEANPAVPIPIVGLSLFTDLDEARAVRKLASGWHKDASGNYLEYELTFTPGLGRYDGVNFSVYVAKADASCQRVQTGVKHVEAVEAHDEPVYEWVCDPADDDQPTA